MGVDSWLITLLMLACVGAQGISFDADESFSTGIQFWEREEDEELEPLSASEFPIWRRSGAAKVPVNVDSFGAVGDGIADDTQALTIDTSSKLRVKGLTIQSAQQMHFTIYRSTAIRITGVRVKSPPDSPNTDGIHISESTDISIQNCRIGTGAQKN